MIKNKVKTTVLGLLWGCLGSAYSMAEPQAGNLVVIHNGEPRACIVTAEAPSADAQAAASTLVDIVRQMTATTLPIESENQFKGDRVAILVGPSRLAKERGIDILQDRDAEGEHYVIRTGYNFVALVGNDDLELRGTTYAVYDLLHRLGCGWFGPNSKWHVIPQRKTLVVAPMDVDERPAFLHRSIQATQMDAGYDKHRYRMAWRLWGISVGYDHALDRVVPRSKYLEDHPEYFGRGQPCLTHPDVFAIAADYCRKIIDKHERGIVPIALGANDNPNFCQCQRCRTFGNVSARALHFANEVARRLAKVRPNRYLLNFLAYWVTHEPPKPMLQAEPGVCAMMVNEGDHVHPWDGPEFATQGRTNTREKAHFVGWQQTGALKAIYEWWIPGHANKNWRLVPWYSGETAMHNLRHWKRGGVRYVYYESSGIGDPSQRFSVRWPLYYVAAQGLWNPDLTADQIMTEACAKLFGSAAADMFQFYKVLEKAMVQSKLTGGNWSLPNPHHIYTPPIEARATTHLDRAIQTATDPQILARIEDQQRMWHRARQVLTKLRDQEAERQRKIEAGEPQLEGLILHHDYYKGSGRDLTGNGRDAILGAGAAQRANYVELSGQTDSRVTFSTRGNDGRTLQQIVEESDGNATIEIWFEGRDLEAGRRQYVIFDGREHGPEASEEATGLTVRLDMVRQLPTVSYGFTEDDGHEGEPRRLSVDDRGAQKPRMKGGMININRLHQYVIVLYGDKISGKRNVSVHINGRGRVVHTTTLNQDPFVSPPTAEVFSVGGTQGDWFGHDAPRGKLCRLLIYNRRLDRPFVIDHNYEFGLQAIRKSLQKQAFTE